MNELVQVYSDGRGITELKKVCEVFGKHHKHVMRDIRNIIKDLPTLKDEYIETTYKDEQGKPRPTYYLTEKGFTILVSSFRGTKARLFQSEFYDAFKALQDENTLLRGVCTELLCIGTNSGPAKKALTTQEIIDKIKELQEDNNKLLMNNYITSNTYCISDIAQKFKDLNPADAQHLLYENNILEWRGNGVFPSEYYDKNNTIVSVLDTNRNRYYPRYTLKGVMMVEQFLIDHGYVYKGLD